MEEESRKQKYYRSLKSRKWRNLREKVLKRDEYKCTACGSKQSLVVHHTFYYWEYTEPWEYPLESLITLCEDCHNDFHKHHEVPNHEKKESRRGKKRRRRGRKAEKGRYEDIPQRLRKKVDIKIKPPPLAVIQQRRERHRKKVDGEWVIIEK